ncbi:antiviral reverse transcriptase Drt5 [Mesorhizobium sp. Root552]|uniref:antiviral reverse transcriptase Drt5 n=1 Tax=Mesorhizobium sp. Root552 TaxID=1736555 RepID=UPI0009EBC963|nr:antiviral reverse transcriptase Drt5 [Mesorhizobium sp. Root552]
MAEKGRDRQTKRNLPIDERTFYLNDYSQTLFPLKTNRFLAEYGFAKLLAFSRDAAATDEDTSQAFLPQRSVSAMKAGWHQRRTVKLDPVAEAFIYDFMFRNRRLIRGAISTKRECYGYVFKDGGPISPTFSYKGFKGAKSEYAKKYKHSLSFDVSSYFNSIYHHDLTEWADDRKFSSDDTRLLGRYLRETKSGRSVDCLPQGLYPTKMIGNDFLKFVDNSFRLKSPQLIRFMDDVVILSNNKSDIQSDFYVIQDLLGQRGLSINSAKTKTSEEDNDVLKAIDKVKEGLLRKRRIFIHNQYIQNESEKQRNLTNKEIERLKEMLSEPHLEEEDAELILSLMGEKSEDVLQKFDDLLENFPNLSKNMYSFCRHIVDKDSLAEIIYAYLKNAKFIPEYQLFWVGMILEDYLLKTKLAESIIYMIVESANSTPITHAKILEIPSSDFGLPEFRLTHLREGKSDWHAWSAAVGSRGASKGTRNQILKYYKNASPINSLISDIVSSYSAEET